MDLILVGKAAGGLRHLLIKKSNSDVNENDCTAYVSLCNVIAQELLLSDYHDFIIESIPTSISEEEEKRALKLLAAADAFLDNE